MKLTDLIECLNEKTVYGDADIEIKSIVDDTRHISEDCLMVCIKGENFNSHLLYKEIESSGAAAVVTEEKLNVSIPQIVVKNSRAALSYLSSEFFGRPSEKLKMIGITGTNGKTTVSYMLKSVMESSGAKVGVIGTLGAVFSGRKMITNMTTPDPIYLNFILSEMVKSGVEYCVMEVSAHALNYDKEIAVKYSAVVCTNLSQDHLDFFEDMNAYASAKLKLINERSSAFKIINVDDERFRDVALRSRNCLTYGIDNPSDVFCIIEEEKLNYTKVLLNVFDELCSVKLKLIGRFNVYNALAAAACAYKLGFCAEDIERGLNAVSGVEGRMERVGEINGGYIFIDYAHTPDGLQKSIQTLKKACGGRVISLFGCGGNRDKSKRPIMGEIASALADYVILTSDNPRFEDPVQIMFDIERGINRGSYVLMENREQAICYGIKLLKRGDVLLIAGKGAEEYQEIAGVKYKYSDRETVMRLLC